jgi:hypothetical protein
MMTGAGSAGGGATEADQSEVINEKINLPKGSVLDFLLMYSFSPLVLFWVVFGCATSLA